MTSLEDINAITSESNQPYLPTNAERLALTQSGALLKFASENLKELDPDLPLAIAEATTAASTNNWTPATSQRFWKTFNQLTTLVHPVAMDGLDATHPTIRRTFRLAFWRDPVAESLAERCTRQYMTWLILLLIFIVPMQLFMWMYTHFSAELEHRSDTIKVAAASLATICADLGKVQDAATARGEDPTKAIMGDGWNKLLQASLELTTQAEQLKNSAQFLAKITLDGQSLNTIQNSKPTVNSSGTWVECATPAALYSTAFQTASATVAQARLLSSILLQFCLPILFGAIGALAFVLRNASEQIRTSTFSATSPIRNMVRVILGVLMGVVVGLFSGGLSAQVSLPPLAMAFLAGYGVEAVFSVFDGFISRLRESDNSRPINGQSKK